jgi:hypothetical protein
VDYGARPGASDHCVSYFSVGLVPPIQFLHLLTALLTTSRGWPISKMTLQLNEGLIGVDKASQG